MNTCGLLNRYDECIKLFMWYSFEIFMYFSFKEREKAKDLPGESWKSESESERVYTQVCSFENITYHVGDFVYVEPSEPNLKPHIVCIERLWEDEAGNRNIHPFFGKKVIISWPKFRYNYANCIINMQS